MLLKPGLRHGCSPAPCRTWAEWNVAIYRLVGCEPRAGECVQTIPVRSYGEARLLVSRLAGRPGYAARILRRGIPFGLETCAPGYLP